MYLHHHVVVWENNNVCGMRESACPSRQTWQRRFEFMGGVSMRFEIAADTDRGIVKKLIRIVCW